MGAAIGGGGGGDGGRRQQLRKDLPSTAANAGQGAVCDSGAAGDDRLHEDAQSVRIQCN